MFAQLYRQRCYPWLLDRIANHDAIATCRKRLLKDVRGKTLEIGFGTAMNLPYYPASLRELYTIEPNPGMLRRARKRLQSTDIKLITSDVLSEDLDFADNTFDTIVSTLTLCSIADPGKALQQLRRVLRPAGQLLFFEHGLAPDRNIQDWQHRLTPIHRCLGDGCHLNRNMKELLLQANFNITKLDTFYLDKSPRVLGYAYLGTATKQ